MRKKLLAIFSAILVACSLCVVGTSVSALDDSKSAATVVDVNYTDNYAGFAGQATQINFGAPSGLADWAEYEDKTCIEYVNAAGEDKLVSLGVQGNYLLINRYAAANVGDVVTLKAGFAWGESEIKEDVSYKFAAVGSPWVKVTEGDNTVNYVDVAVNNVWLYNNTSWGAPTIEVKLSIPAENTIPQYYNALSTVNIEYEKADGSKGNLADFTCANPGEGRFIIRLADNGQAENMYYAENGDKFIIRAGSYVLDGNTAYRVTKDLTYVCEDASNTNGFVLQVNLEDAVSTSVSHVYLYNDATWTKPALQVSLNIPDYTLALGQYANVVKNMKMEYVPAGGGTVNVPEFTHLGSNNFLIRPTVNEGTFAVSIGDKFIIKADSYVTDGNGVYAIREDAAFIVASLSNGRMKPYVANTVTFDANGGVLADEATQTVYTLGTVTEPADPTKAGYKFAGWTLDGAAYNFDTPVVGDITLVASWKTVEYPFRKGADAFKYGAQWLGVPQGAEAGAWQIVYYNFGAAGAQMGADGYIALQANQIPVFGITYYLDVTLADSSTARLYTNVDGKPMYFVDENGVVTEYAIQYGGATMPVELSNVPGMILIPISTFNPTGDIDWSKVLSLGLQIDSFYNHSFFMNLGEVAYIPGDMYEATANKIVNINSANDVMAQIGNASNGSLAILSPVYTITFDTLGGTAVNPAQVYEGLTVTAPADPTKAADAEYTYTFAGWTLNGADYDFASPVMGDITLVAKYTTVKNTYTVTFNANGGVLTDDATKTLEYGSLITVTNPTKESTNDFDYVFEGWKADGQLVDLATYTVTGDVELKASWTANRRYYTVTFDANGGVLGSQGSELKKYGETVSAVDPTRYATDEYTYTFAGWKVDGEFVDLATYTVTGNVTLVAEWTATKNSYTVTFELNGGVFSGETTMVVEYGTIISRPAAPTKEGYNFVGWAADGGVYLFNEPVTGDITIVAAWSIKTFTVTFDADGGELAGDATATVEYGSAITVTDPTKAGYTFEGWTIDGEEVDLDTYVVTGDVTLVATWEEIPAPAPAPEDKGCGSALVGTLIPSMVALIAAGVVVTSKKKRD